jgi:glycosyltransferase involved in cell wall biosynthesis
VRLVVLCPHPLDRAPGQRLKFEKYYASWERAGYQVDVRSFWSHWAWQYLYAPGHIGRKAVSVAAGFARRLMDLRAALRADVVYLFLEAAPLGPPLLERRIRRRGVPMVYDIDDLVHLPHSSSSNRFMSRLRSSDKVLELMGQADHVVVGTEYLRQFALQHNPRVTYIPPTIDLAKYHARPHRAHTDGVVVGWSGSHSTAPYLHLLDSVLLELQRTENIRIKVIGDGNFAIDGAAVDAQPWRLESEVEDLSQIDIGVYPLPDEEWVLGKGGGKALQYMALGIPTVAQRIGSNLEIIDHGGNGLLASTRDEWLEHLRRLIRNPDLRARLGEGGRRTVEERYSVTVTEPRYLGILEEVTEKRRNPQSTENPSRR